MLPTPSAMMSFLSEFVNDVGRRTRVIFVDDEISGEPRQYTIRPVSVLSVLAGIAAALVVVVVAVVAFTPVRLLIPGYGTDEIRRSARLNVLRLQAMEDSLRVQGEYVAHLRSMITGQLGADPADSVSGPLNEVAEGEPDRPSMLVSPTSENWADHRQTLADIDRLPVRTVSDTGGDAIERYLSAPAFPVLPPVEGFLTRDFDARIGHFGIDFAAQEGSVVRSIGDGYVILADWTHEGGHALAIQHPKGYISVYKHNQRLLKNVGDRVRPREPVALSGNSGEITTGPHLHFELWQNGLAQDPRNFLLSL